MTAVAAPSHGFLLTRSDQTLLEQLVQQQFWLFGADIRRPSGNLLLELGFTRYRAPDPAQGSSCYAAPETEGPAVHLWGFGCCLTAPDDGRIFLSRHRALVRRMPATIALEGLHSVPQLHSLCHSDPDDHLLPIQQIALFRWFEHYERLALTHIGAEEREATLTQFGRRQICSAAEIPARWDHLATTIAQTAP